ncbi:hypothetical protein AMATHDRAFT_86179 [Amanita thiersii Skay4041]|uniref:NAD(P)-binding protein n=1 Tax=Amanita thiersii Skay4041 TaxID=703135 RepID=A0A2A9NQ77_9AGAR|nr:hypothetical protein AMATHDRAFT_86179 [Amanita thiersii Skay4041]
MSLLRQIPPTSYTLQNILISMSTIVLSVSSLMFTTVIVLPLSIARVLIPRRIKANALSSRCDTNTRNQRKVVLIIGASRGIGYGVVREYAVETGTTIIAVSKTMENLKGMATELGPTNARLILKNLDISGSPGEIAQTVKQLDEECGPITHLYAISGISNHLDDKRPWNLDVSVEMISVNVTGIVTVVLATFDRMKARKFGTICIVGSAAGLFNPANMITYASTKAFINTFASSLRILALEHNVEVITVTPGFIDTRMTSRMRGQGSTVPAFEFASAQEMARQMKKGVEGGGTGVIGWPTRQAIMMYALRGLNPICEDLGRLVSYVARVAGNKTT